MSLSGDWKAAEEATQGLGRIRYASDLASKAASLCTATWRVGSPRAFRQHQTKQQSSRVESYSLKVWPTYFERLVRRLYTRPPKVDSLYIYRVAISTATITKACIPIQPL